MIAYKEEITHTDLSDLPVGLSNQILVACLQTKWLLQLRIVWIDVIFTCLSFAIVSPFNSLRFVPSLSLGRHVFNKKCFRVHLLRWGRETKLFTRQKCGFFVRWHEQYKKIVVQLGYHLYTCFFLLCITNLHAHYCYVFNFFCSKYPVHHGAYFHIATLSLSASSCFWFIFTCLLHPCQPLHVLTVSCMYNLLINMQHLMATRYL